MNCKQCGDALKTTDRRQRFCSKACWYSFNSGHRHAQYTSVTLTCEACGESFSRNPFEVAKSKHYFCSQACAASQHGQKVTASKNGRWRGGELQTRGRSWGKDRLDALRRQDFRCADCGMSNEEHKAIYKKGLIGHHRKPYRLVQDSSPENTVALCVTCHAKAEALLLKQIPAEGVALMVQNTPAIKNREGNHRARAAECPGCGGEKSERAALCRSCSSKKRSKTTTVCPACGGRKARQSARCSSCQPGRPKKAPDTHPCAECGKPISPSSTRCRSCSSRLNGGKHATHPR